VTEKDKQIETLYHRDMSQQHTVDLYQQLTNDENTDFINKRIAQFEEIKQQREFRKEEISHQLRQLWQRLHIEQQVIEDFLMKNRGLTFDDMTKVKGLYYTTKTK
jgi:hypothetical protein